MPWIFCRSTRISLSAIPSVEQAQVFQARDDLVDGFASVVGLLAAGDDQLARPEQKRLDEPDVVALLFGSGKLVITGGKQPDDAREAVDKIVSRLEDLSLLD